VALVLVALTLTLLAGFALEVEVFVVVTFLADLGLFVEEVDLAETGAARGEAEVFEDIATKYGQSGR